MRVVSLACSNTEIVAALGCAEMLVGVDDHSDYPVDVVRSLPRVGPDLDIDVDRVADLSPDLVLASLTVPGHERVVSDLERAGLPTVVLAPRSVADVYDDITRVGDLLGVSSAAGTLVGTMRGELGDGSRPIPEADAPSVLIQWWPKPSIVPGDQSWATDLLHRAGGENPLAGEAVESRPVSDDEVAAIAPDAIVLSWCGVQPRKYRPDVVLGKSAWSDVPAVRNGRVFCVPEAWLGRPGPRMVQGLHALRLVVGQSRRSSV